MNSDWGYLANCVAELPVVETDDAEIIQVLNTMPLYIGQSPSYVRDQFSFQVKYAYATINLALQIQIIFFVCRAGFVV